MEDSDTIVIDLSYPTNLKDEFLLDSDNLLTLVQEWDCSRTLSTKSMKYYLQCNYPSVWKDEPLIQNW